MLRTGRHFEYSKISSLNLNDEYRIAPYDYITVTVLPNNGEKMLVNNRQIELDFTLSVQVESDGKAKFPIFNRIQMTGMTVREAEIYLEKKYSAYYNDPFVIVKVSNRRIFLLSNRGGTSRTFNLVNDNTTIFELMASAGGLTDGKAYKIKLIRGDLKNPQVYLIDLSTIKGVINSNIVLQANDIIYIETPLRLHQRIITEITPYITFVSTLFLYYGIINKWL